MIIYKTTNIINNKIYIGQTKSKSKYYLGSGKLLKYSIKKHGKENFIRETLCECETQEELNRMERFWIEEFNSTNLNIGYNLESGGNSHDDYEKYKQKIGISMLGNTNALGFKHTDETKEKLRNLAKNRIMSVDQKLKIRNSLIGNKHSLGHKHSEESKKKMSKSQFGKTHSDESKKNMSESAKGRKHSEETRRKMSESHKKRFISSD